MKVIFHTGTPGPRFGLFQNALLTKRDKLAENGILVPKAAGGADHIYALIAGVGPGSQHPILAARGAVDPTLHEAVVNESLGEIGKEIAKTRPHTMILTMTDMWSWCDTSERLNRFISGLSRFSDDVHAVLHLANPAEALRQHLFWQIKFGRALPMAHEHAIAADPQGWGKAANALEQGDGQDISRLNLPTASIDQAHTLHLWQTILGKDQVLLRGLPKKWTVDALYKEMRDCFDLPAKIGRVARADLKVQPNTPGRGWLSRAFQLNKAIVAFEKETDLGPLPIRIRQQKYAEISVPEGDRPLTEADLAGLTQGIAPLPGIETDPEPGPIWDIEAENTYDAAPHFEGLEQLVRERIKAVKARQMRRKRQIEARKKEIEKSGIALSPDAEKMLSNVAKKTVKDLYTSRFAPHNNVHFGFDETQDLPMLPVTPEAPLTETLLIACMKDEAPYILEWIAYHKSIGVDHFLIFTNDCSDGTDDLLDRLEKLGHVTHKRNDEWKGKSPQQAALNKAIKMPLVQKAKWLIHCDVDEYINIRMGQGTLAELYDGAGDATNIAMTWRLFGNAHVEHIGDAQVMENFTRCAPAFAPKPHTMWGFKTITRNVGVYGKLSCHRPNKPVDDPPQPVRWMNGSLRDMTDEGARSGNWRNSIRSIGYNAVQLNHYALRSRDSYLIKRKRGRALHTDRTIGLNYWVRHDWNSYEDRSILRHRDRMMAQKEMLLADKKLAKIHADGLAWHYARVKELDATESFQQLRLETTQAELKDFERVAYAMAADMES